MANGAEKPNLFTVYTFRQTAGRGQAGNAWESEDGKNISMSVLVRVKSIAEAARLNLLVPLAVVEGITKSGNHGIAEELTIKWPNDVYWGDRKVAGLLNENVIIGSEVAYTVAGIGVNVNQEVFRSDAPNPVSLKQITGRTYELEPMIDAIVEELERLLPLLEDYDALKQAYMARLYRRTGLHPYVEREVSVAPTTIATATEVKGPQRSRSSGAKRRKERSKVKGAFLAEIADVDEFGRLVLRTESGELKTYHFKEIRYVL